MYLSLSQFEFRKSITGKSKDILRIIRKDKNKIYLYICSVDFLCNGTPSYTDTLVVSLEK